MERRCYFFNNRLCPETCPLHKLTDEEMAARYSSTIWADNFPGFNQESKGQNARKLDKQNCEKIAQQRS